jgi:hypothetical protein
MVICAFGGPISIQDTNIMGMQLECFGKKIIKNNRFMAKHHQLAGNQLPKNYVTLQRLIFHFPTPH